MKRSRSSTWWRLLTIALVIPVGGGLGPWLLVWCLSASGQEVQLPPPTSNPQAPFPTPPELMQIDLLRQTAEQAAAKSTGCVACHKDVHEPHFKETVHLGCCDCHGGDPNAPTKEQAHVRARFPDAWPSSGNPKRSYALLNHELPEFIRFVNPGDLRVAHLSCGTTGCHATEVLQNRKSMMAHGCMLWGAALYNNGAYPLKWSHFGESYGMTGVPLRLQNWPPPTDKELSCKGLLPYLDPLPRFEISQPGNVLRIFERGGRIVPDIGIPAQVEEPGRPRTRLSIRGLGTENRTDPVFVGLQKTRLLDPTLNLLGTNDHPGDYRSSGCTACHVIYANDRSPVNSGPYAPYGHMGTSYSPDPTIPKNESGHPIQHRFTTAIPTSQCIVCHVHPGTNVMNSYLGYMWWDEETDGEFMYPNKQKHPTAEEVIAAAMNNPDEASLQGNWSNPEFVDHAAELNPQLNHIQLADFHGHGWLFRAVFKKDRKGNYLDHQGRLLMNVAAPQLMAAVKVPERVQEDIRKGPDQPSPRQPYRDHLPVHQLDIHLEKGMHCIDCHFTQDNHGNTKLYGEVRAAIEIQCTDCHGTVTKRPTLRTTGPAATPNGGRDLAALRTPFGKRRFEWRGDKLYQNSMVDPKLSWEISQVKDVITPGNPHYNERARLAKTVRFKPGTREFEWGDVPGGDDKACAHANCNMSCIACHSSWNPSCFGCHLPQRANMKMPTLHWEGDVSRNYVAYDFQTLRDDVYMLARDGDVTGNRIGPARSSCAIHVSSYNSSRESIYVQQQTISAEGLSGIAFSTNVPHTVRGGPPHGPDGKPLSPDVFLPGCSETKSCTDCHVSRNDDNNAIMAQLLMHGTGYTNFMGKYCWVAAGEHGLDAVVVTEQNEPQAVIGSTLQKLAFPEDYHKHLKHHSLLQHAHHHPGFGIGEQMLHPFHKPNILQVQARGEYLYAACGEDGVRVFDIAFIDNKGFSERITTAPVSPLGQKFYVRTKYATALAAPCTMAPDPTRVHFPVNHEPVIPAMYGYLYVTDKYEGLILIGAATTINGNPNDNFLHRDLTFNPDGILNGARSIAIVGTYAYICCDAGVVVVSIEDPMHPKVTAVMGHPELEEPVAVTAQFRYGFVCDKKGVHVLDITDPAKPHHLTEMELEEAHSIYVARTYAYVAAGKQGLVILDIENPEKPRIDQVYNADGCINDLKDVKLGITYVSEFAYLADGKNGLRVVQLTSPHTPGNYGFSPRPTPHLIATYKIPKGGEALNVSRALDRDRAVDEAGNQICVFGRVGARPLNAKEQRKLYLKDDKVWKVSDNPADYPPPVNPGAPGQGQPEALPPPTPVQRR